MTTTAFDDQFVSATETILALNVRDECQQVHDLQVRLAAAIQRATDAEAEMAKLREQAPAGWVDADGDFYHGRNYPNVFPTAVPVYAAPIPAQAPAVPELDPMTRLIVSDPKQIKPKKQKPAVPEFCAVEAQLTLAETEMLNAKAWSPGTQAKRHIDFAMTAICYASALLQSAEVKK